MRFVLTALLVSPHFLYRAELGEADPQNPAVRVLSDFEVASKLSYFLWDGPPDAELFARAEANAFVDATTLGASVSRLLADPRFEGGAVSLFNDYLNLSRLDSIEKLASDFPQFSESLLESMRRETELDLWRATGAGVDFRSVFNSPTTFVNQELAELYGIGGVVGAAFVEVTPPVTAPRRGLLGNASVLSLYAHASASSPTLRGKFVRESLLCQKIPSPPPDVDTTLPDTSQAPTTRERFTQHSTDLACAGCHQLMDPVGLGLENYDAIGAYRSTENGFPIDPSGDLDGTAFTSPDGLADALAVHPGVPTCLARSVFRYAWGRLETSAEEPWLTEISADFANSGFQLRQLLEGAALSPDFQITGALD
jgi:hypothetical protein